MQEEIGEAETSPFFFGGKMFYLYHLTDIQSDPPSNLTLSATTIQLCLDALIAAENRYNWRESLEELDDTEWGQAQAFLTTAINELTA